MQQLVVGQRVLGKRADRLMKELHGKQEVPLAIFLAASAPSGISIAACQALVDAGLACVHLDTCSS
jgi:hypothetical protein